MESFLSDVDALVPKRQYHTLYDRAKDKEYKVDLFMPGEIGLLFIDNEKTISGLLDGKIDKKTLELIWEIFEMMFASQHKFMNKVWCKKNIDVFSVIAILLKMGKPLYDYLKTIGMVKPAKKPEETEDQDQLNLRQ